MSSKEVKTYTEDRKSYLTITEERGYFLRKRYRKGKTKRQKTTIIKPNMQKVKLMNINGLELYVYPQDFPDRVFIGIYPLSIELKQRDIRNLLGMYNKSRWFLANEWQKKRKQTKEAKTSRQAIIRGIDYARNHRKKPKSGEFLLN